MYVLVNGLLFRSVEALIAYLKAHPGESMDIKYVTEYTLGDPMEQ